ncbi:MAG: hypothetical protein VZR02_05095 [Lachnospiraceae bacterium]|nr:hypothetical protein [Lachnospiraceae bacterium]
MTGFAKLDQTLRAYYGRHSTFVDMAGKFILAMISFFWIRSVLNYQPVFSNPVLLLLLALLATVFPSTMIPVFSCILVVGQASAVGIDAAVVAAVFMLVLVILFLRFVAEDAVAFSLVPVAIFFGFSALVPLFCGLKRKLSSVLAVACGTVLYYFMAALSREGSAIQQLPLSSFDKRLSLLIGGTFTSTCFINVIAMIAVVVVVHAIRALGISHGHLVAVPVGGIVYLMFIVLGNAVLGTSFAIPTVLIGTVASCIAVYLLILIMLPLDYAKTERLEFEDDDYYYYVKAVPKVAVTQRASKGGESEEEPVEKPDLTDVDFEKKLEDSLRNL